MNAQAKLMALQFSDEEGQLLMAKLNGGPEQQKEAEAFIAHKLRNGGAVELSQDKLRELLASVERPSPDDDDEAPEDDEAPDEEAPGKGENISAVALIGKLRRVMLQTIQTDAKSQFTFDVLANVHYLMHKADGLVMEQAMVHITRANNLICAAMKMLVEEKFDYPTVTFVTNEMRELNALREKADCAGSA